MSKLKSMCRIFVIDDELIIATSLGEILRREGFDVSWFTDPLKALEAMYAKPPDLLIADVVMPGMSGIDLATVVRENWPECPVMLFSGALSTSALLESARAQGRDFEVLAKPVPPAEIIARVFKGLGIPADKPADA
jgi:DNA-binding response OmpR family regulator